MNTTLVADIGGSNTRLAVAGRTGRPEHVHAFANDSVSGLVEAMPPCSPSRGPFKVVGSC
jgi:glucokinase